MKDNPEEEGQIMIMREKYQYTPTIDIDKAKVDELFELCQDMLKDTKGFICSKKVD